MAFKDALVLTIFSWLSQNFYGIELIFLATFSLLLLQLYLLFHENKVFIFYFFKFSILLQDIDYSVLYGKNLLFIYFIYSSLYPLIPSS